MKNERLVSVLTQMVGAFRAGAAAGFTGTLVGTGGDVGAALMGGLIGGVSAYLTAGIGGHLKSKSLYVADHGMRALAHGAAQGTISQLRGGRFREGFFSAVVGHLLPMPQGLLRMSGAGGRIARAAFAGIAGGITTHLGGGKFANGAWTAAFVRLFNADGSESRKDAIIKNMRRLGQEIADQAKAIQEPFGLWLSKSRMNDPNYFKVASMNEDLDAIKATGVAWWMGKVAKDNMSMSYGIRVVSYRGVLSKFMSSAYSNIDFGSNIRSFVSCDFQNASCGFKIYDAESKSVLYKW